jgi:hypothetical protein
MAEARRDRVGGGDSASAIEKMGYGDKVTLSPPRRRLPGVMEGKERRAWPACWINKEV